MAEKGRAGGVTRSNFLVEREPDWLTGGYNPSLF